MLSILKGQVKLKQKLRDIAKEQGKGKGKEGGERKNKKNTFNKTRKKEDKACKKIPHEDSNKKSKAIGKHTYHWCEHRMEWTVYLPAECCLSKKQKEDQKAKPACKTRSAIVTAAAASAINLQYQLGVRTRFDKISNGPTTNSECSNLLYRLTLYYLESKNTTITSSLGGLNMRIMFRVGLVFGVWWVLDKG